MQNRAINWVDVSTFVLNQGSERFDLPWFCGVWAKTYAMTSTCLMHKLLKGCFLVKRLFKALDGYAALMKADYLFSASHKLPGSKGKIREDAVVSFLEAFAPKNFNLASSVFAVSLKGEEYSRELDIVLHDPSIGGFWALDKLGLNSVCTFEGIRLILEVKSTIDQETLDDTEKKAAELRGFAIQEGLDPPGFVLFGFTVGEEKGDWLGVDTLVQRAEENCIDLDALICPDHFSYFSSDHDNFAMGFEEGISAGLAESDGPVQERQIIKRFSGSRYSEGFIEVGGSPGHRLLSLAAFMSHCAGDDTPLIALLAAALKPNHNPIG